MATFRAKLYDYLCAGNATPSRGALQRLAEHTGLERATLSSWLRKPKAVQPSLEKVQQLAATTGIHIAYWTCDGIESKSLTEARLWSQWVAPLLTGEEPSAATRGAQNDLLARCNQACQVLLEDLSTLCNIQSRAVTDPESARIELERVEQIRQAASKHDHKKKG